jgi:antitoxin CcdA
VIRFCTPGLRFCERSAEAKSAAQERRSTYIQEFFNWAQGYGPGQAFALYSVYYGGIQMEHLKMVSTTKRKTSLTLDAEVLDGAKALKINVSAVAEAALKNAVASARQMHWRKQNAEAFAAQAVWHERHGHPLADIMSAPGGASWNA